MYRRRRLSRAQLREYVTCAKEMQAEGDVLDIPDDWMEPSPLTVRDDGAVGNVCVVGGILIYVIPITIVAHGRVLICDYEAYSEWGDRIELVYLRRRNGRCQFGTLDYPASEVLNDHFESGFRLNFRGDMLRGIIIGHGGATPKDYGAARSVAVNMSLTDSLARKSAESRIQLPVTHAPTRGDRSPQQTNVQENRIDPIYRSDTVHAGWTAMGGGPEKLRAPGE